MRKRRGRRLRRNSMDYRLGGIGASNLGQALGARHRSGDLGVSLFLWHSTERSDTLGMEGVNA
jgi:hypothetical protein